MSGAAQSSGGVPPPPHGTSLGRGAGEPLGGTAVLDPWAFPGRCAGDPSAVHGLRLTGRTSCACVERSSRCIERNVSRT
jgi:hypothetical protein